MKLDIVDHVDRSLRLRWAGYLIREGNGWYGLPSDPTPFPLLHLFPQWHRAARPLRRLELRRLRRRRGARAHPSRWPR